ncbi:hypothetical protein [Spirosoma sp. 209]|uniref:hypothetical protein n=1 Tax=Spirosoma sp. 209 TaxID=1955701 RepID=UPI00098D32E7|nr:hypothetical protein [Spirosoma sp. 209]
MNRTNRKRPFAADYTYTVDENIIAIIDLDLGNRSVTNDIDSVLEEIRAEIGDLAGYSVIYRDSMGRWDGVRLVGGTPGRRAVEFYSINEPTQERAQTHLLHLVQQ